jgi:hypothetical protein
MGKVPSLVQQGHYLKQCQETKEEEALHKGTK